MEAGAAGETDFSEGGSERYAAAGMRPESALFADQLVGAGAAEETEPFFFIGGRETLRRRYEMKSGFTYNQIEHLNAELRERDLPYKINYRDRTTAGIQELGVCASIGKRNLCGLQYGNFFKEREWRWNFRRADWRSSRRSTIVPEILSEVPE